MLTALIPTLCLAAVVAALLWRDQRKDAETAIEREATAKAQATEREAWARERSELLNRIKPETAQPVILADAKPLPAVNLEDDDQYWKDAVATLEAETRTLIEARS